jgi:hypothetical protein
MRLRQALFVYRRDIFRASLGVRWEAGFAGSQKNMSADVPVNARR